MKLEKLHDRKCYDLQKNEVLTVQVMKAYRGSSGTAPLILNLITRQRRMADSSTGCITPSKESWYLNTKLSGPQNRSEHCEKEKSLLHVLGFELWTIQPTA